MRMYPQRRQPAFTSLIVALILSIGLCTAATTAFAEAEFKLKLVGINRSNDLYKLWEDFSKSVQEKTNGRVEFELTSLPELGFGGAELIRMMKRGIVDVAEIYGGYVAGEVPLMEILELPGIFKDGEMAQKAIMAWKDSESEILKQRADAVVLAMSAYPDQAFFTKKPINSLADFKGLKTRVHSVALSRLVAGLGGEPLTIAFAEVYTAMERGTVDAAITGTKPGYDQRWYEVAEYLVGPISMRPHVAFAINRKVWNKMPEDIQKIMREEAADKIEAATFKQLEGWNQEGIDKSVEKGMTHQPFTPEVRDAITKVLREKVIPDWIERAGGQKAADLFNEIIAPLVGYEVQP